MQRIDKWLPQGDRMSYFDLREIMKRDYKVQGDKAPAKEYHYNHLAAIKQFARYMFDVKLSSKLSTVKPRDDRSEITVSMDHLQAAIKRCLGLNHKSEQTKINYEWAAYIGVSVCTALRHSDIRHLKWSNFSVFGEKVVCTVKASKTKKIAKFLLP